MNFRSSASFGKRQEYVAIAELLKRGYDVYVTLVDDQGIDCIVRQGPNTYFDVQIKARSRNVTPRNAGYFPILPVSAPRTRYVFIFYSETLDIHWVIPSSTLAKKGFCNQAKSGKNKGSYKIKLTNHSIFRQTVTPRPKYDKYINAFEKAFGKPPLKKIRDPILD